MIKRNLTIYFRLMVVACVIAIAPISAPSALAQPIIDLDAVPAPTPGEMATYADLVTLADRSELVIRAEIRRQTRLKPERAPGLAPGFVRLYIEARTTALLSGASAVGESLEYLVDVPLDERGKVPKLKRSEVLLFANAVPGRPGSVQLTSSLAQFAYTPELEDRLRPILKGLIAADAPPVIKGISDALAVRGTIVGESETQVFLQTSIGSPVSLTVRRRPNQSPEWGVSWGEIIDAAAKPPSSQSIRWYRLACSLPAQLPSSANLARDPDARRLAEQDYRTVIEGLGPCKRQITAAS